MKRINLVFLILILLAAVLAGCSGDPHRKILLSDKYVFAEQRSLAGNLKLYLNKNVENYIIDVVGTGMRSGARYTIYAGKSLLAGAPLSLKKIARNVVVINKPSSSGSVVHLSFGEKTELIPGSANFSESEVTIELVCKIYKNGKRVFSRSIVKSNRRNSALGFCSPILIIRKQILQSYDDAIGEAGSESLRQALEELNVRIVKSGLRL